jgi:hypothetical protein
MLQSGRQWSRPAIPSARASARARETDITHDFSPPPTQRVGSSRRTPVAVALVALAVVGVLVWKPWGVATPPPLVSPPAFAAVPTAEPAATTPTVMPTVSLVPLPLPSSAAPGPTQAPPSPTVRVSQPGLAFLVRDDGLPFAQCVYNTGTDGERHLVGVVAGSPLVVRNAESASESELRAVRWHFELQVNALEQLFNADWVTVATSPVQRFAMPSWEPASSEPVKLRYDSRRDGTTAVYRVAVVVDWLGRRGRLLDTLRVVATAYAPSDRVATVVPDGCHAIDNARAQPTD